VDAVPDVENPPFSFCGGAGWKARDCLPDGWLAGASILAGVLTGFCLLDGLETAWLKEAGDAGAGTLDEAGMEAGGGSGLEAGEELGRDDLTCNTWSLCCRPETWSCCASNFFSQSLFNKNNCFMR
jgi:hypothetical protein